MGNADVGSLYLFHGPIDGDVTLDDAVATIDDPRWTRRVLDFDITGRGVGDINNDGFDDIVVAVSDDTATGQGMAAVYIAENSTLIAPS